MRQYDPRFDQEPRETVQTKGMYQEQRPRRRAFLRTMAVIGIFALAAAAVVLLLPAAFLDDYLTDEITEALKTEYPSHEIRLTGLHYSIVRNTLECDSVVIAKIDSTMTCSFTTVSVTGVQRWKLLTGGAIAPDELASSRADAQNIVLTFAHPQYELRCARLKLSAPDSALVVEILQLQPPNGDSAYFAQSPTRETRFRLSIPECRITGLACLGLLQGRYYRARSAVMPEVSLSVLINKEKQSNRHGTPPLMPKDLLASIGGPVEIDTITIVNGRLMYSERFGAGADPAVLTCDSMRITATGINSEADTAVLIADGRFMNDGKVRLRLAMPMSSPGLTFGITGSLGRMHLKSFNPFIEQAEGKRLKTGILHSLNFGVEVNDGKARGDIRAAYEDLKLASIDRKTGSESGLGNTLESILANNISLRTSNMPDASGAMKIGKVKHTKLRDEAFFGFAWTSVRSGLGDVVGF